MGVENSLGPVAIWSSCKELGICSKDSDQAMEERLEAMDRRDRDAFENIGREAGIL